MFRNFLKTTFRNLWKNKSYVIINVIGLSLCLACCVVAYLNYKYSADFDKNHVNHERIYKVQITKASGEATQPYGITPLALYSSIKDEFTGVSHYTRYNNPSMVLKKDLKIFNKTIAFADDDFFEMFTFPFKYGNAEAFLQKGNIILSEETAEVYFGEMDPTGELITVIEDDGTQHAMIVGGVLEDIPNNSMLKFHAITHFEQYIDFQEVENSDWGRFIAATFFMTETNDYPDHVIKTINDKYIAVQNEARPDWEVSGYYLDVLTTLGKNSIEIWANWLSQPPPDPAVTVPLIMAVLMLLIACFNFTNTSIAISSKRLKEIGVRKVMGSSRTQVIYQFMGENMMLVLISIIFALAISMWLVPAYSSMWGFINLKLDLTTNPEIYLFLFGLMVFTSLVAGAYPSIYISSFQPVSILRGTLRLGRVSGLSKVLLSSQYTLTVIALIASLAFAQNARYQEALDVGFNKTNIISVRADNNSEFERYFNSVSQMSSIESVVGTRNHIGSWNYGRTLRNGEKELESGMLDFGINYYDIMDLEMIKGRYFDNDTYESDRQNSIIVNQQMVEAFKWEEPIGQVLRLDDTTRLTVIGVMKDFHMWGFWNPISPLGIRLADKEDIGFLIVKTQPGKLQDTYKELEAKWYDVAPIKPFNGNYMDEQLKESTETNNNITIMFTFLGLLALVLSSIGLYTLVSLTVIKRVKEIGIRRALGATISNIIGIMNRPFYLLLIVAAVIGASLSYFAIDGLMGSIWAYYKALSIWSIILPLFVLFFISILTASTKVFTAAAKNPVDSLRYE